MQIEASTTRRASQVCPDIDVTSRHLVRAYEDVAAVAAGAIDPDRVLARVCSRSVECDFPSLIAIRRVRGPSRLVPALLESFRDLSNGEGRKRKSKESRLS